MLNKLIDFVKNPQYDNKKTAATNAVSAIRTSIENLEETILKYDLDTESTNVETEISNLQKKINARRERFIRQKNESDRRCF